MLALILAALKFVFIVFLFVLPVASLMTWHERRQSAYSQDRIGPVRAGLGGLAHILADGLKMFFKEPFMPREADAALFRLAPLFGFVTALMVAALIPFAPDLRLGDSVVPMQVARVDAGILLVFAIASLGIYGTALAGWASNNRFALLGGIRAAAQQISYEIALGLTVVGVLIAYGTTELGALVQAQGGMLMGFLPNWGLFVQPLGATLFLVAAMAETKRAPFDMPEGESEIIGYFLEYSSMGFGLFMLGEFAEIVVLSMLFTTLFLGGWQLPWILGEGSVSLGFWYSEAPWAVSLVGFGVFALKVYLLSMLQIQIRWSLPRFRYDQLMHLGWKVLLPLALLNIAGTALIVWWDPSLELAAQLGLGLMTLFVLVVIAGPGRGRGRAVHAAAGH